MAKPIAEFINCPGYGTTQEQHFVHEMRDYCYSCAPFWKVIPICPTHKKKLTKKGYCRECKKHYDTNERPVK